MQPPAERPDATIVVCTYNRADSLRETLCALRSLEAPPGLRWQVIVVDNNSTDHTAQTVRELSRHWPQLEYVFEPAQGLSHARNRGIAVARGEFILFTDDDVLPQRDWLERTLDGLHRLQADACGGYIAPIWERRPPAWLTERFHGFLAVRMDREDDGLLRSGDPTPFGANMAFRKSVFDQVGLFDTSRGRIGKVLASGEDGEMFERLRAAGLRLAFLGSARVQHKVEAFRCTKAYLRRWRRQTSRNLALSRGVPGERRLFNVPLYLLPQTLRAALRVLSGHLNCAPDEAFNRELVFCHFLGTLEGLYRSRAGAALRARQATR